ncbi:MAG: hypothetical protein Q4D54_03085 [Eubacteriales bacterium]|nr:hypothetical protein [Eubacteriales bacterium]
MSAQIGIYDSDFDYANALMEYINVQGDGMMQSAAFSEMETLQRYVEQTNPELILSGDALPDSYQDENGVRVIRLSETDAPAYANEQYIYKYQRMDVLVRQLASMLQIKTSDDAEYPLFYGVYSPIGRCGKTTFAFSVCHNFEESLYIGMDSYIGSTNVSQDIFRQSELFYFHLLTHNEEIMETVRAVGSFAGTSFSIVYGLRNFTDYKQITSEDVAWFRQTLKAKSQIRRVVFDIGAGVLSDFGLLCEFDHLFVPCLSDAYSQRLLDHFHILVKEVPDKMPSAYISYIEVPMDSYDSPVLRDYVHQKGI